MPGPVHRLAVAAIGTGCFALAGVIRVLPWGRWGDSATLVLIVPLLALVDLTEFAGTPARTDTVLVFLLFAWVGAHQPRWSSLWLAPLAGIAYTVPMVVKGRATPFGLLSVLLMIVACMLVAELIADIAEQRRAVGKGAPFPCRQHQRPCGAVQPGRGGPVRLPVCGAHARHEPRGPARGAQSATSAIRTT